MTVKRRLAYLAAAAALVGYGAQPGTAHAQLPDPAAILATSRVPVVPGIATSYGQCPNRHVGCAWPGDKIVIDGDAHRTDDVRGAVSVTLFHEAGHVFAAHVGPGPVQRFATITHDRPTFDLEERFADAYMACALGWRPRPRFWNNDPNFPTGNEYSPTPRRHRAVCAMIRRAGHRL